MSHTPLTDTLDQHDVSCQSSAATQPVDSQPLRADTVNVTGNVSSVQSNTINVRDGGIAQARADQMTISVTDGGIGAVLSSHTEVSVTDGGIGAVFARQADIRDATVAFVASPNVSLSGNSRVIFDIRAGIAFGAIVGSLLSIGNFMLRMRRHAPALTASLRPSSQKR
jgi:hypothetical protein